MKVDRVQHISSDTTMPIYKVEKRIERGNPTSPSRGKEFWVVTHYDWIVVGDVEEVECIFGPPAAQVKS